MNFGFGLKHKKVKELRKNQGYTVKELAERLRIEPIELKRIDELALKEVPKALREKIEPILRGADTDKIPWLK